MREEWCGGALDFESVQHIEQIYAKSVQCVEQKGGFEAYFGAKCSVCRTKLPLKCFVY